MSRSSNRLGNETSPYLLQHAHNPVDWFPWGPDALERARALNKPIFLSVGYSTCYWCHVMERQCFENQAIAEVMNRHFICIKVDREERPDVDQLYMTAVQVMTRQGGWPMSVWLTPDGRPFYGGTYFPPADAYGRPGFPSLLEALADAWINRHDEVQRSANELTDIIRRVSSETSTHPTPAPDAREVDALVLRSCEDYEPKHGGFGQAPKFPRQTLLRLLLTWIESKPADDAGRARVSKMLRHTLDAMANGGIRDHLGGGFHRYSTDARWLVPHFEIMLYDQAMLAPVYARAARVFDEPRYARVARGICDFVIREMTDPQRGSFYTAFDAEVDAQEGLNYLWTREQVEAQLQSECTDFCSVYGIDLGPNFADPHHGNGVPESNILYLPNGSAREDDPAIAGMRAKLLAARARRKQPLLDTKVLTSWNGLMIEALATCGIELAEPRYRDVAIRAADFLLHVHVHEDGTLLRSSRDGAAKQEAFLDDYASFAVALQELGIATSDRRWTEAAGRILDRMVSRFGPAAASDAGGASDDASGAFFFTSITSTDLFARQKTASDSPLPSGNALAAFSLLWAGRLELARGIVEAFAEPLRRHPEGSSALLENALLLRQHGQAWSDAIQLGAVTGVGWTDPDEPDQTQVVRCSATRIGPRRIDLQVNIARGYHLYDTNINDKLGLTATRLRAGGDWADRVESIEYPPADELNLPYGPPMRGYSGRIELSIRFRDDLPATPVELSLSCQACDDKACLLPSVIRCAG